MDILEALRYLHAERERVISQIDALERIQKQEEAAARVLGRKSPGPVSGRTRAKVVKKKRAKGG